MSKGVDVIVIGGGVIGAAVAYYLVRAGVQTMLLDRGDVASGTSSACDGNIVAIGQRPGFDSQMTLESQRLLEVLVEEMDCDVEYTRKGSVLVVEDESQVAFARSWYERQKQAGLPMRYIEGDAIFESEPLLARDVVGLVECASDGALNPMAFAYAMIRAARKGGAVIAPFTEAQDILVDACGAVKGVRSRGRILRSKRVVLATGIWTAEVARSVGLEIPIIPRKGHILVGEKTPIRATRKVQELGYVMAKNPETGKRDVDRETEERGVALVYEPCESGNFLLGSSREFTGFDSTCDKRVLQLIAKRAVRFFPCLRELHVIRTYAGLRPFTIDHRPIVSEVESIPGLFIAAGHEGTGIAQAPITGQMIASMIAETKCAIQPEALSIKRFEVKQQQERMV